MKNYEKALTAWRRPRDTPNGVRYMAEPFDIWRCHSIYLLTQIRYIRTVFGFDMCLRHEGWWSLSFGRGMVKFVLWTRDGEVCLLDKWSWRRSVKFPYGEWSFACGKVFWKALECMEKTLRLHSGWRLLTLSVSRYIRTLFGCDMCPWHEGWWSLSFGQVKLTKVSEVPLWGVKFCLRQSFAVQSFGVKRGWHF